MRRQRIGGRHLPDDEQLLSGTNQPQIPARVFLDDGGVLAELSRPLAQACVFFPRLHERLSSRAILLSGLDHPGEALLANERVDRDDAANEDE